MRMDEGTWRWSVASIVVLSTLSGGIQAQEGEVAPPPAAEPASAPEAAPPAEPPSAGSDATKSNTSEPEAAPADDRKLGWSWAALPLANYNSDEGVGYGVKGAVYKVTPDSNPYQHQVSLMLFFTTKKVMYHEFLWDAPNFRGSGVRMETRLIFDQTLLNNYFGVGNEVAPVLPYGTEGEEALGEAEEVANRYYTLYSLQQPTFIFNTRKDLTGPLKLFSGVKYKYTVVTPFDSERVEQQSGVAVPDDYTTLFEQDNPYGASGGHLATAQLGVIRDTRDQEPSPDRGGFSELSLRGNYYAAGDPAEQVDASPLFWGVNLTARRYLPIPGPVVLALRFVGDAALGDVPVFELPKFGGSRDYGGIGGSIALRGVVFNHYIGKAKMLAGTELRVIPYTAHIKDNKLDIMTVAYLDTGRVWTDYNTDEGGGLHSAAGGGLRFAWNNNFLVRFDMAWSLTDDDSGIYLVFDHAY